MKRINAYRKYIVAALTPLLLWGTDALVRWSVTRKGLALLILAEAGALGVGAVSNEPLQMFTIIVLIAGGLVTLTIIAGVVWAIVAPEKPDDDSLS